MGHKKTTFSNTGLTVPLLLTVIAALGQWASGQEQATKVQPRAAGPPAADRAIVLHAGNAVQLTVPGDWHIREASVGRQIRLLVSALPIDESDKDVADGIWLGLEYHPEGVTKQSHEEMVQRIVTRLQARFGSRIQIQDSRPLTLGQHQASGCEFEIAPDPNGTSSLRGFAATVQTAWCRCHIQVTAPVQLADQRTASFERILEGLKLVRPPWPAVQSTPRVKAAAPILGSWKARTSRLRLHGDGLISVVTDEPFKFVSAAGDQHHEGRVINGRFRANGDLLYIEWDDQSKLNYRWRLQGNQLLMTDHEGRLTQLARIAE